MTIAMPDSTAPGNIPMGYPAYLGYADGNFQTAARLAALFPGAHVVTLTVTGATLDADGIDCEPDNVNAVQAAAWVKRKLAVVPSSLPVVYADLDTPGYSMAEVIAVLLALGITRAQYRILSAHYTGTAHICSPATCRDSDGKPIAWTADGTQWTDSYPGLNGTKIDMSALNGDFFGAPVINWQETMMQQLPVVRQGGNGDVVRTVQGLCAARGHAVTVDGVFGAVTMAAVKAVQAAARITADGTVGAQTWPVLLGV